MKRKLGIDEYVFSYRKEDLKNAILEYDFDNKINCIIVKDLSRLGRNYIEVGKYID